MLTKVCTKCSEEKTLDNFCKQRRGKFGCHSQCKSCKKAYADQYYKVHKEERMAYNKLWVAQDKDYYKKMDRTEYQRVWRENNRASYNALKAKRRAYKASATPPWLTLIQLQEIESFYSLAKECETLTGDKYHVDHIIPLKGKDVCGLHVPWNLQVLPADINISKGNR